VGLVRARPGQVALRRVDVTRSETWSIPLPFVRVFDASGRLILERGSDGDLEALKAAVRAAVESAAPR
jgi:hypothetical protein